MANVRRVYLDTLGKGVTPPIVVAVIDCRDDWGKKFLEKLGENVSTDWLDRMRQQQQIPTATIGIYGPEAIELLGAMTPNGHTALQKITNLPGMIPTVLVAAAGNPYGAIADTEASSDLH